jgi:hypothetical protein
VEVVARRPAARAMCTPGGVRTLSFSDAGGSEAELGLSHRVKGGESEPEPEPEPELETAAPVEHVCARCAQRFASR